MSKYLIGLDAGHGINTAGKRTCPLTKDIIMDGKTYKKGATIKEREFNQRILKLVEKELDRISDIKYIECVGPISEDTSLANRVKRANDNKVDLFISIHANALTGTSQDKAQGLVCIHTKNSSAKSITMTKNLYNRLSKEVNWYKDGATRYGVRTDVDLTGNTYYVLRNTTMPASLLELGFMDNMNDVENMATDKFAKDCAKAIAKGICDTLNIKYIEENTTQSQITSSFKIQVIVDNLNVRKVADWNAQAITTVKKGQWLDVIDTVEAKNGSTKMYKLESGLYITSSSKYVKKY